MNTAFLAKMIQAKKLEYEAFRELMPDPMKEQADKFTDNLASSLKAIALQIISETKQYGSECSQTEKDTSKSTRKVPVDFE